MEKSCTKCGEIKLLEDFAVSSRNKSGRAAECKECGRARDEIRRARLKEIGFVADSATCIGCNETKPAKKFSKSTTKKNGLSSYCKDCDSIATSEWQKKFPEKSNEKGRAWYEANREKAIKQKKVYRDANKGKEAKRGKNWREKFPEKVAAKSAKRRAAELERIPSWSNDDDLKAIRKIYARCKKINELTGVEHHVDHVIPLQGENVSGLHHSTNLAIIPAALNLSKNNSWEFQEVHYG